MPLLVVAALAGGCGGQSPAAPEGSSTPAGAAPAPASAGLHFTVSPVDLNDLIYIVPIGKMQPWGHTLPTDHAYLYHYDGNGIAPSVPVYAPAGGRIDAMNGGRIDVRVDAVYSYWIGPVVYANGIAVGAEIAAGTLLGTHGTFPALDFAVMKTTQQLNFVNPLRYSPETLYCDGPMQYFEGPVRSAILAKVRRSGGQIDGKIDYDVAGTLSGNWYAEDLPVAESARGGEEYYGVRKLSFARDVTSPDEPRISVGGLGLTGLYAVDADAPAFTNITPASGLVVFRLLNPAAPGQPPSTTQIGWLLLQMLDGTHLRVEAVGITISQPSAAGAPPASFSANAQLYLR